MANCASASALRDATMALFHPPPAQNLLARESECKGKVLGDTAGVIFGQQCVVFATFRQALLFFLPHQ
jgi:hypothetical protein